ncbi:unnamed protein product, partial [Prorocentrum cordatum]
LLVHVGAPWPTGGSQPITIFGDASGGKHGTDERRRRVGVGLAVIEVCGPRWRLAAGAIATLPGRRQTVPRGEIFAFALALEQLDADIHYVTDNMPLLKGWNAQRWLNLGKGANSDLWARIGRSLQAHPNRQVGVTWTPSHQEDEGEPMVSHFLAAGNCCADRLANLGARAAAASADRSTPHADRWDVIASQVRRRARQALLDAAGGDPWLSERPAAEQVARPSALQRAIDDSPHQLVTVGQGKWKCLLCRQLFPAATLHEAAASACAATEADWASFDHVRKVSAGMQIAMGAGVVHASHRLYEWPANSLYFCGVCGAHGTTMGMGLRGECKGETTRKTDEALRRIAKGVYPSHQGPPKPVIEAKAISATIAHVVGGGLAPADPAIPEDLPEAGTMEHQLEAVIGILHGQALQAAQRPSRKQAREPDGPQPTARRRRRASSDPGAGQGENATAAATAQELPAAAPAPLVGQRRRRSQTEVAVQATGGPLGPRLWLPDHTSPLSVRPVAQQAQSGNPKWSTPRRLAGPPPGPPAGSRRRLSSGSTRLDARRRANA